MKAHPPKPARRASWPGSGKRLALGAWALLLVLGLLVLPVQPASAATFTVTKTADTNDGTCNADCSLREAIVAANASAGPHTITIPAGTYTLSIPGANENAAATGDLDILQSMTLNGAGSASTIIQAGASAANGIDKVFSVNPNFNIALNVTFSGMTIRLRQEPERAILADGFGGGLDFEASGTGNLTLTDCIVTDNTTADGDGGGLVASDFTGSPPGGGLVTITQQHDQQQPSGPDRREFSLRRRDLLRPQHEVHPHEHQHHGQLGDGLRGAGPGRRHLRRPERLAHGIGDPRRHASRTTRRPATAAASTRPMR